MGKTVQFAPNIRVGGSTLDLFLSALGIDEDSGGLKEYEIAASGSQTVNFDGVTTASAIVITGDRTFTFNATGVGASQAYNAGGIVVLWNCAETSLVVANTDGSDTMILKVYLGGT